MSPRCTQHYFRRVLQYLSASPFKGGHAIKENEAVEFCKQLEDEGPVSCMLAISESGIAHRCYLLSTGLMTA